MIAIAIDSLEERFSDNRGKQRAGELPRAWSLTPRCPARASPMQQVLADARRVTVHWDPPDSDVQAAPILGDPSRSAADPHTPYCPSFPKSLAGSSDIRGE